MSRYGGVSRCLNPEIIEHQRWLEQQGRSQTTRDEYRNRVRALARWLEVRKSTLLTADATLLRQWRSSLTVGHGTVLGYVCAVRSFYRWAIWDRRITTDPTADLPLPRVRARRPRPIGEEQLVIAINEAPARIRQWLILAALAGLRACEIAALRREDILDTADEPIMIVRGKGDKERIIPLSPQLWGELVLGGLPVSGPIARKERGRGPITAKAVSGAVNAYLRRVGVDATLHQLRHRFGTKAYAVKRDIRVVQDLMGHASPVTTAGYAAFANGAAIDTVLGVQLPLQQPDRRELTRDPAAVKIPRPPEVPVRPRVHQRKPPVLLSGRKFPVGRFELAVQHAGSDDHQVREARRVPARIVIVERAQAIAGYLTPYQPEEGSLIHQWLMSPRRRPEVVP